MKRLLFVCMTLNTLQASQSSAIRVINKTEQLLCIITIDKNNEVPKRELYQLHPEEMIEVGENVWFQRPDGFETVYNKFEKEYEIHRKKQ